MTLERSLFASVSYSVYASVERDVSDSVYLSVLYSVREDVDDSIYWKVWDTLTPVLDLVTAKIKSL